MKVLLARFGIITEDVRRVFYELTGVQYDSNIPRCDWDLIEAVETVKTFSEDARWRYSLGDATAPGNYFIYESENGEEKLIPDYKAWKEKYLHVSGLEGSIQDGE
jgi:hypothetical protein